MDGQHPLITLLSDFGTDDTYVGQVKGVIAGICPRATVIDLTHAVFPLAVEHGAFLLDTSIAAFRHGAVHLAIVDPGVGTDRATLAIQAGPSFFVGPDNGLLSCAVPAESRPPASARIPIPTGIMAVVLPHPTDTPVSPTFHGRDIFAVAAARLACGATLASLGEPAHSLVTLPLFRARPQGADRLEGRVLHFDRFGNVITSVHVSQLPADPRAVRIGKTRVRSFVRAYGDDAGLVALIGSSGYLEVAKVNGSAIESMRVEIGDSVIVEL